MGGPSLPVGGRQLIRHGQTGARSIGPDRAASGANGRATGPHIEVPLQAVEPASPVRSSPIFRGTLSPLKARRSIVIAATHRSGWSVVTTRALRSPPVSPVPIDLHSAGASERTQREDT